MIETSHSSPPIVGLTLNYRDAERTCRCANNLLDDGVVHVLVWDNSEDEGKSANALRAMLASDQRVSIEISGKNLGFAAGVNRGLANLNARFPNAWVLLINNDAVLRPGATRELAKALMETPQAVIAYPGIDHHGRYIETAYYQRHLGLITTRPLPGSISYASGCCQLLEPSRLSGAWFDESFFMYGEDMEQGYRLGADRMRPVPGARVTHEGSASSGMASTFYETRMVAAHWLLARKMARNRLDLILLYVGRTIALTVRALLRAWRYRSREPLTALRAGWRLAHPVN